MNKQVKEAYFAELLKSFKKSNQAKKLKIATKAGKTVEQYVAYLKKEAGLKLTAAKKPAAPKKKAEQQPTTVTETTTAAPATTTKVRMEKPTIHNVYILDASSSMSGEKFDFALMGINEEIQKLKADDTVNYTQTNVVFSFAKNIAFHHFMIPIANVSRLSAVSYGSTALYDAIGTTFNKLQENVKEGEKVLIKIFTDGQENDSKIHTRHSISLRIKELEEKGYTIAFMGTRQDVDFVTRNLNIDESNTLVHENTAQSVKASFTRSTVETMSYSDNVKKGLDVKKGFYKRTGTLDGK